MEVEEKDNLQKYYDYLKGAKADVPNTFESFQKTLSNEDDAKKYYDYLKSNKFDAPDTYDSFANTLGLKKKGFSLESLAKGESIASMYGIKSEKLLPPSAEEKKVEKPPVVSEKKPETEPQKKVNPEAKTLGEWLTAIPGELDRATARLLDGVDWLINEPQNALVQLFFGKKDANEYMKLKEQGLINMPSALPDPVKGLSDLLTYTASGTRPLPSGKGWKGIVGQSIKGAVDVVPDILAATVTPEILVPKALADLGIKTFGKFGVEQGLRGLVEGSQEAEKGTDVQKMTLPLLNSIEKGVAGAMFEGMGARSAEIGERLAEKIIPNPQTYVSQLNKSILANGTSSLTNGLFFAGYGGLDEFARTGKISPDNMYSSFGMGLAMSVPAMGRLLFARSMNSLLTMPEEGIANAINSDKKPLDMAKEAIILSDKVDRGESENKELDAIKAIMLARSAQFKSFADEIHADPEGMKKIINDSKLEPEIKEKLISKIDEINKGVLDARNAERDKELLAKEAEEKKAKDPNEIAKKEENGLVYQGQTKDEQGNPTLDNYVDKETNANFSVPIGSDEKTVLAKRDEVVKPIKEKPREEWMDWDKTTFIKKLTQEKKSDKLKDQLEMAAKAHPEWGVKFKADASEVAPKSKLTPKEEAESKIDYDAFFKGLNKKIKQPKNKEEMSDLMQEIESTVEEVGYRFEIDPDADPDFSSVNVFYMGEPIDVEQLPPTMKGVFDTYAELFHRSHPATEEISSEKTKAIQETQKPEIKKGSRTENAIKTAPNNFTDAAMQFFIGGGRISRRDFKDHSGWSEADIKKSGLGFLLSKTGQNLDVFHESLANSFGKEDQGPMDMINEVVDLLKSYPTRSKMLDAFEKRQGIEKPFEPTEDETKKAMNDEILNDLWKTHGVLNDKVIDDAVSLGFIDKAQGEEFKKQLANENRELEERRAEDEQGGVREEVSPGEEKGGGSTEKPSTRLWRDKEGIPESVKNRFGIADQEFTPEDVDNIPTKPLWTQNGRNVVLVDDNYMKTHFYSNWTEGGNSAVYPEWNPKGDIHVAANVEEGKRKFVAAHEIWEEYKVEKKGLKYSSPQGSAHEQSNKMEIPLRRFEEETLKPKGGEVTSINVTDEGFNFKYKEIADGPEKEATMFPDGTMKDGKHGNDLGVETETKPNEKPSEPSVTTGKGEKDKLPGGGEGIEKPVTKEGEQKPEPKAGEIKEIPVKKIEETSTGIKYNGKTYVDIEDVQDAFDKKELTFDEQKPLIETVRKFEDGLKKGATDNSKNIKKRFDASDEESGKRLKDETKPDGKLFVRLLPPDILSKGNTLLWKNIFQPLRDKMSNWLADKIQKGEQSQIDALRWVSKAVTNWYGGLGRTQEDIMGKLRMTGTVKEFAPYHASQLRDELLKIVGSNPESLERVRDVLDPEIAKQKLNYGDLTNSEKNLYWKLRDLNTWVHETNYANGFIDAKTYLKFKDETGTPKYIARLYDEFETMPSEVEGFIKQGNNAMKTTLQADIFKMRQEMDDWKKEHAITDPVYLTTKRVMQTIQNEAVLHYMQQVESQHPTFVRKLKEGDPVPKGFTKLSGSRKWGDMRNRAVINHIVEDFTGFFYANHIMNTTYDALKMWDRNKVNQFYKKFRTAYNPFVQTGNFTGNLFFGSIAGINPVQLTSKMPEAIRDAKTGTAEYKEVLKSGILGATGITGDMTPIVSQQTNIGKNTIKSENVLTKARGLFDKFDKAATKLYQGADNTAKYAAYKVFREQGLTHEQAIRRTYDSFQNYSTVGKIWDTASKVPMVGPTFVKFQADLQRILLNAATMSPMTTVGTLMLVSLLGKTMSALSGETEEEQKIRESRKGVARIPLPFGMSIPLSYKIGKSEFNFARYLAPLYVYKYEDSDMDLSELSKFLPFNIDKIDKPQLGEKGYALGFGDATWGWLGSLIADRDFRGLSIQNPDASAFHNPNITTGERIANVLNYVGRTQIPFYKSGQDMYDAITGQMDYYGRKRDWRQAILNNIIKVQQFNKPEIKSYVERNIDYLTNKYNSLAQRMGDANNDFLKKMNDAKEKGMSEEMLAKLYKSEDKTRSNRLQKSVDEQIPVMQELERLTGVYKKWYPDDPFLQENYKNVEEGKIRRFNVLDNVDLQKKYPKEFNLLKSNDLIKTPIIPKYYMGEPVTEEERKEYSNIYWREYLQNLDLFVGMTPEQFDEAKKLSIDKGISITSEGPRTQTMLQIQASEAARIASELAKISFKEK